MKISVAELIKQAQKSAQRGQKESALVLAGQALQLEPNNRSILEINLRLSYQLNRTELVQQTLLRLIDLVPENLQYSISLAQSYVDNGQADQSPRVFEPLLHKFNHPDLYFNYAWFLTRAASYDKAIIYYKKSIAHNLQGAEEAHLNLANIYSTWLLQPDNAEMHLKLALKLRPDYIDALYNLANLHEDRGNRDSANRYFRKIRSLEPHHAKALARLGMAATLNESQSIIDQLQNLLQSTTLGDDDRIDCLYSLGKLYDQNKHYPAAFDAWEAANKLNGSMLGRFDHSIFKDHIDNIISTYSNVHFERMTPCHEESPIFIGGMFRSGSTLLEQILASHPKICAAGELDFFPRKFRQLTHLSSPHSTAILKDIGEQYLKLLTSLNSGTELVTDKRPDNILYFGFIKSIFPSAKLVITKRNPIDNCLSIYSHRFGSDMKYSCDLDDIMFYSNQVDRLVAHWRDLFPNSIHQVDYEDLINQSQQTISDTLRFLDLEWDKSCLKFYTLRNVVSTASVWQVRQPLYTSSCGRWQNYHSQLKYLCL